MSDPVAVPGWEGLYMVTDVGQVLSLPRTVKRSDGWTQTRCLRFLTPSKSDNNGYLRVRLCAHGRFRTFGVHRLVALAFIPNPSGYPEVNHLDGDKTNNVVGNLEWTTSRGNQQHAVETGLRKCGEDHPSAKLTWALVASARERHGQGCSIQQLAREYRVSHSAIDAAIRGKSWKRPPPRQKLGHQGETEPPA